MSIKRQQSRKCMKNKNYLLAMKWDDRDRKEKKGSNRNAFLDQPQSSER